MKQHNSSDEGRNCWKTARERDRLRARFSIRQRVGGTPSSQIVASYSRMQQTFQEKELQDVLTKIHAKDRAAFSVTFLAAQHDLLSQPVSTGFILLRMPEQLLWSWFGKDGTQQLQDYIQGLETLSLMEYTVLLGRYFILGSLLLGGINPCLRGRAKGDHLLKDTIWEEQNKQLGMQVLQTFFSSFPLGLSSYIVKRVVDMRRQAYQNRSNTASNGKIKSTTICSCCQKEIPASFQLNFGSPCYHDFCELCFWKDILETVNNRQGDVVLCPCCHLSPSSVEDDPASSPETSIAHYFPEDECSEDGTSPQQRGQASLRKFQALPLDARQLKKSKQKKSKILERHVLCSSWSKAVIPSLGLSQSVRREKFWTFVEKGAIHYVKGCLDEGIDVNDRNEYGQTALFVAAWRGNEQLFVMLLQYGADPTVLPHGNCSIEQVSRRNGHYDMVHALLMQQWTETTPARPMPDIEPRVSILASLPTKMISNQDSFFSVKVLIPPERDHPGAGSFLISNIFPDGVMDLLVDVWRSLPVSVDSQKKKNTPCSVRSYFCDAENILCTMMASALANTTEPLLNSKNVVVFPHMRFLHYSQVGTALAPHVDLCRVNPSSGERSTHSFLLYLHDCTCGGETSLLESLAGDGRQISLSDVKPQRGALLLFPHNCPHEGKPVQDVPKLLIRGEVRLPLWEAQRASVDITQ